MTRYRRRIARLFPLILWFAFAPVWSADTVPNEIKMPGTQAQEVDPLDAVDQCELCHGNYDPAVEPVHNWRGSMMAQAGRDPLFWAALAIAEQHFDGAGDFCTRCHNPGGWIEGRSTPTDGSGLSEFNDRDGVECDLCHRLANPDDSEHLGVQIDPFIANDGGDPPEGNYGSGQYVLMLSSATKYGPYADVNSSHGTQQSLFHRSPELCGTCHDVSNPVTGDLAHNNGAQVPLGYTGTLGDILENKVAFNHRPYEFGIVERTYSEHKASRLASTPVAEYPNLPTDLQAGAIRQAYEAAIASGNNGNYSDGASRYFTCQSCHVSPVTGKGAIRPRRLNPPVRSDLPWHNLTGGNYWMPKAIHWLDSREQLFFGGGLTAAEIAALDDGILRAEANLESAASLRVTGDTLYVVNLTGHKLISGFPEGRRMWLNIKWFDANGLLLREDGAYGALEVTLNGQTTVVNTLLDLHDPNTHIYEVHGAITQEWATQMLEFGYPPELAIAYDRVSGQPEVTLQDVANQPPETYHESFHSALNNYVAKDSRIPPYGFSYDEAERRNCLPVPKTQYGDPGPGGEYNYWDEFTLNPPADAVTASIQLLYQPTSWELAQFLYLANDGSESFLASTGQDYLDAWLNTGMAQPHVMATASWSADGTSEPPLPATIDAIVQNLTTWSVDQFDNLLTQTNLFNQGDTIGVVAEVVDPDGAAVSGATVTVEIRDASGAVMQSLQGTTDNLGAVLVTWETSAPQDSGSWQTTGTPTGVYSAVVTEVVKDGYTWNVEESVTTTSFTLRSGS